MAPSSASKLYPSFTIFNPVKASKPLDKVLISIAVKFLNDKLMDFMIWASAGGGDDETEDGEEEG